MMHTSTAIFVVADGQPLPTDTIAIVTEWARGGLIAPTLWVSPASVTPFGGTAQITAKLLDANGETQVDLLRYLAQQRLESVRVIVAQEVGVASHADQPLLDTAQLVDQTVSNALPRSTTGSGKTTGYYRLNIIIPVSGAQQMPTSILLPRWDKNIVISAEDRPDTTSMNLGVTATNAAPHAALALCAAGGVFPGVGAGCFDRLARQPSTMNNQEVYLARVFARMVVGEDPVSWLALQAVEAVAADKDGFVPFVEWGQVVTDPAAVANAVASEIVQQPPWASPAIKLPPMPVKDQVGVKASFGEAIKYDLQMLGTVPKWLFARKQSQLERAATRAFVGAGGDQEVKLFPELPTELAASANTYLAGVSTAASRNETALLNTSNDAFDPTIWGDLRTDFFSAADGENRSSQLPIPAVSKLIGLVPVNQIAPDPLKWVQIGDRKLRPLDEPELVAETIAALPSTGSADAQAAKVVTRLRTWQQQANNTVAGQLVADIRSRRDAARERYRELQQQETTQMPGLGGLTVAKKRLFRNWIAAILLWILLFTGIIWLWNHLGGREWRNTGTATFTAGTLRVSGPVGQPPVVEFPTPFPITQLSVTLISRGDGAPFEMGQPIQMAQLNFRAESGDEYQNTFGNPETFDFGTVFFGWYDSGADWVVIISEETITNALINARSGARLLVLDDGSGGTYPAVSVMEFTNFEPVPTDLAFRIRSQWYLLALTLLTLGALTSLLLANHNYYKATRAAIGAVHQAAAKRQQDSARIVYYAHESERLDALLKLLLDWLTVIGLVLHHPYRFVDDRRRALDESVAESLPAAFALARVAREDAISTRAMVATVRQLYPLGWAQNTFDRAYQGFAAGSEFQESGGVSAADIDQSSSDYGPRNQLVEYWTSGEATKVNSVEGTKRLTKAIDDGTVNLDQRRVDWLQTGVVAPPVPEVSFYAGITQPPIDFAPEMFTNTAKVSGKPAVGYTSTWLPPTAAAADTPGSHRTREVDSKSVALRADISNALMPADLQLFTGATPTATEPPAAPQAAHIIPEPEYDTEGWA